MTQPLNAAGVAGQPQGSAAVLGVPAQTSPPQGSSTLTGDTANERPESIGRGSKRSLTRKRDPSSGSRRKERVTTSPSEKVSRTADPSQGELQGQPKAKKKGGLLAFLNCCGSSDSQDAGAPDQPAKLATKPQPARVAQPSQVRNQQIADTADTSVDPSKEVIDEKGPSAVYANGSQPEARQSPSDAEKVPTSAVVDQSTPEPPADASRQPSETSALGNPGSESRVVMPPQIITSGAPVEASSVETPTGPSIAVIAPTPTVPQTEDDIISDRTSQQIERDEDIEMNDKLPLTEKEAEEIQNETSQSQGSLTSLPGPPPLPANDGLALSNPQTAAQEQQRWLLPAMRPEHQGRKCLVLDLDETLVHSSFKVCA